MTSVDDFQVNLTSILSMLSKIPMGTRLVLFPENCLYQRIRENSPIPPLGPDSEIFQAIAKEAQRRGHFVHLGSVALDLEEKVFNASVVITPEGAVQVGYQKIHLFDIHLEGKKPFRESDLFSYGQLPRVLTVDDWSLGQSICYDLRFSELFNHYGRLEVDAILVPASFLVETGQAHWEVLLRARAIESQCYVLAAAQAGTHRSGPSERHTYGHSLVVDPWGKVLRSGSAENPEVINVELSFEEIQKVRRQIPMKNHRKL